ncbi:hypothetical protein HELRODRAFT_178188 [Helobdella robusta]|uniref:Uncharacterized protein n=1 Tax=Helobdella robusta TaxID=6412 RepID=T1FCW7_HELRO|nr:hypothetical protein HELRODRAFT_178188 [Helobdella robusta]ESN97397.1 hypothetical protein HELRODRAFT_178188 [Helobdella robusta]
MAFLYPLNFSQNNLFCKSTAKHQMLFTRRPEACTCRCYNFKDLYISNTCVVASKIVKLSFKISDRSTQLLQNKVCKSPGTSKNDYSKKGVMQCQETDDEIKTGDDEMSSLLPKLQFVNIYGSHIMQNLLMFKNVALVVQGLFELSFEELKLLCEDARGTRVIEAFLESTSVSDKLKNAYALKLKENQENIKVK